MRRSTPSSLSARLSAMPRADQRTTSQGRTHGQWPEFVSQAILEWIAHAGIATVLNDLGVKAQ